MQTDPAEPGEIPAPTEGIEIPGIDPLVTIGFVDQLARMRAYYLVGQALGEMFPTAESWDNQVKHAAFLAMVAHVSHALQRVRQSLPELDPDDPQAVQTAVAEHYTTAIDAVEDLAVYLNVDAADLLTFFIAG